MIVDQTYVNNLKSLISSELQSICYNYAVKANNSIIDKKVERDIIRLDSLFTILENYDVNETYFDQDYILKITREWKNYCGYKKPSNDSSVINDDDQISSGSLRRERIYKYTVDSEKTIDNADTEITLPETPVLRFDVTIDQINMEIGDGTKSNCDIWFSNDGGTTVKEFTNIVSGDTMYYNALVVGTSLTTDAKIEFTII